MSDTKLPPAYLLFIERFDETKWGLDSFLIRIREYHLWKARAVALEYLQTPIKDGAKEYIGARRYQLGRVDARSGALVKYESGDVLNIEGRLITSRFEIPAQLRPSIPPKKWVTL